MNEPLDAQVCNALGADSKGTNIYALELLSAVLAADLWCREETKSISC